MQPKTQLQIVRTFFLNVKEKKNIKEDKFEIKFEMNWSIKAK